MRSPEWICKKNEIACHIRRLFEAYGETELDFDEYLAGVLEHPIDEALQCFRDLVKQLEYLKPQGRANEQRLQGSKQGTKEPHQLQPPFARRT